MPDKKVQKKQTVGSKENEQLRKEIENLRGEIREMKEIVNMLLNMVMETDEEEEYPGMEFPGFEDKYGPNN
ncbi:MAG: hypothetical protein QXP70_02880 [Methanomassiliicoccales archaeon]